MPEIIELLADVLTNNFVSCFFLLVFYIYWQISKPKPN